MKDRLQEIFDKQAWYLRTLAPIYRANGFEVKNYWPYHLDSREGQEQFRLLAWRVTEEVYEALDEWNKGINTDPSKYREEVSDILHFLVELALCCGVTTVEFATGGDAALITHEDYLGASFNRVRLYRGRMEGHDAWGLFVARLAGLMMQFRQRPWRTDDRKTDFEAVKFHFGLTWLSFCTACDSTGIGAATLYSHYFAKNIINEERRDANMPETNK